MEKITAKHGLLWVRGEVIPLPRADWVAHRHGFVCCERMMKAMESGEYPNPVNDPPEIKEEI
jgi:hypothetical protein